MAKNTYGRAKSRKQKSATYAQKLSAEAVQVLRENCAHLFRLAIEQPHQFETDLFQSDNVTLQFVAQIVEFMDGVANRVSFERRDDPLLEDGHLVISRLVGPEAGDGDLRIVINGEAQTEL